MLASSARIAFFLVCLFSAAGLLRAEGHPAVRSNTSTRACVNGGTLITSAQGLSDIRKNLAGNYCLGQDIDLSSIANWTPIGTAAAPFTGDFNGASCTDVNFSNTCSTFRVRNLKIVSASKLVGLFGAINESAGLVIQNLQLSGINIVVNVPDHSTFPHVGGIAGDLESGLIIYSHVTGTIKVKVTYPDSGEIVGGMVGKLAGTIQESFTDVQITVTGGGMGGGGIGGLVGKACCRIFANNNNEIEYAHAFGSVTASSVVGNNEHTGVGGLVGTNGAQIVVSYSTGNVTGGTATNTGGLVGFSGIDPNYGENALASISVSYATGKVSAGAESRVGGLEGWLYDLDITDSYASGDVVGSIGGSAGGLVGLVGCSICSATVKSDYSTGHVAVGTGGTAGGFLGVIDNDVFAVVSKSYWDTQTSGQTTSAGTPGAKGLSTATLMGTLPSGLSSTKWGISTGASYPYLRGINTWLPVMTSPAITITDRYVSYRAPLATQHSTQGQSSLVAIGQLEPWQYHVYDETTAWTASKAAVFAMIGRALGDMNPNFFVTYQDGTSGPLESVRVDYFLDSDGAIWPSKGSPNQDEQIRSRVRFYSAGTQVPSPLNAYAVPFDRSGVISSLRAGQMVLVRGCTTNRTCSAIARDGPGYQWMLATALDQDATGNVTGLIANDPELGQQVTIDMNPASPTYRQVISPTNYRHLTHLYFTALWSLSAQFVVPGQ